MVKVAEEGSATYGADMKETFSLVIALRLTD